MQEKQADSPALLRPVYELGHKCIRLLYLLRFI